MQFPEPPVGEGDSNSGPRALTASAPRGREIIAVPRLRKHLTELQSPICHVPARHTPASSPSASRRPGCTPSATCDRPTGGTHEPGPVRSAPAAGSARLCGKPGQGRGYRDRSGGAGPVGVSRAWPDGGVPERRAQVGACPEEVGPGRGALGGRGVLGGAAL